ncbi:hypothetical protein QWZ10_15450 [Paracoccus cavernae]|uniref:Uncharacterized protein n=1 Tax=Paracoccus cavernae TaxID=1571207 RepID=A0ABT8D7S9_9RHOB|nr:hypothetical protein [Paracoccus cavernae]
MAAADGLGLDAAPRGGDALAHLEEDGRIEIGAIPARGTGACGF